MTFPQSTLGAPLTAEEVRSIDLAVGELKLFVDTISDQNPSALLGLSIAVIDKAFKLRATIEKAFGEANTRAFAPRPKANFVRGVSPNTLLDKLGLDSKEDLENALKELGLK
jgi:hypothetical protein